MVPLSNLQSYTVLLGIFGVAYSSDSESFQMILDDFGWFSAGASKWFCMINAHWLLLSLEFFTNGQIEQSGDSTGSDSKRLQETCGYCHKVYKLQLRVSYKIFLFNFWLKISYWEFLTESFLLRSFLLRISYWEPLTENLLMRFLQKEPS